MVDLHKVVLKALSLPLGLLLHSNHLLCLCVILAGSALCLPFHSVFFVSFAALFTLLASHRSAPPRLPRYQGSLDVLLGRSYRASSDTPEMEANNNVTMASFAGGLVVAYRKADSHFASPLARIVVTKADTENLESWTDVWEYCTGEDDLREMLFYQVQGTLYMSFACLAPYKRGFSPRQSRWTCTRDLKVWSDPVSFGRASEIVWDVKVRTEAGQEVVYKASYVGNHYAGDAVLTILFERSSDGRSWAAVGDNAAVHTGGICEVSFEFTSSGDLVAIGRNEDGDASGFGTQLFFARSTDLSAWTALKVSLPYRFDSPRLVASDGELLLFARYARQPYKWVSELMPFGIQRLVNLLVYSALPKKAAVYHLTPPDQDGAWSEKPVTLIRFFEETFGDTGFFSVASHEPTKEVFVANYGSSSCHSHAPWIVGQVNPTDVRVCRCQVLRCK